jgi:undecaprenyl-diphosphatase
MIVLATILLVALGEAASGLDATLVHWAAARRSDLLDRVALDVTALGNTTTLAVLVVAVALVLWPTRPRAALLLPVILAGGRLLTEAVKALVDRPRPDLVEWLTHAVAPAFPSAHAASAAMVYGTLAWLVHTSGARPGVRRATWAAVIPLVLAIGASRVYLGVHWPSDVLGGFLLGAGWAAVVLAAPGAMGRPRARDPACAPPPPRT